MRAALLLVPLVALAGCRKPEELPPESQLAGTITDRDSGRAIGNATVTAKSIPKTFAATSGTDGKYEIRGLTPAVTYSVIASAVDYESASLELKPEEGPNAADFVLSLRRVCTPGDKHCAPPAVGAAVLTCNAAGTDYDSVSCARGEICFPENNSCVRQPTLSLMLGGAGDGRVQSMPSGINCPPDCDAAMLAGTPVTLVARPEAFSTFGNWNTGPCMMSRTPTCSFSLSADLMISVRFDSTFPRLDTTKTGMGVGHVRSTPAGIDCPPDCIERYPPNSAVTLQATPDPGSVFAGWMLCPMPMGNTCHITFGTNGLQVIFRFDPFFLGALSADTNCRTLLHFDPTARLTQGCGMGPAAVATGTTGFVPSRNATLQDAIEIRGPTEQGTIDSMKTGPAAPEGTVEMTIHRLGNAFEARGFAVLFSDQPLHADTAPGFRMVVQDDGRLQAATYDGTGMLSSVETPAGAIAVGTWYHVAASIDAAVGLRLSIDGQTAAEIAGPLAWTASSSTAWIGSARADATGASLGRFNGRIDEVRVSAVARY